MDRSQPPTGKLVGMGGCGVDYVAQVASYPRANDKLRTEKLEVQGGGNCGNALTAAARLGLPVAIVSKIGGDALGDGIVAEFARDCVDTRHLLRASGAPSPFTYIIVDREGSTRTCIHTPSEPMLEAEMSDQLARSVLQGAALLFFDGRLTEAALRLAARAREAGVPVLVEAERLRPGLEQLLGCADYVITSQNFPQEWSGEGVMGDAVLSTFARLPHIRWMVTTLGAQGSVMLERDTGLGAEGSAAALEHLLQQGLGGCGAQVPHPSSDEVACTSSTGVRVLEGAVMSWPQPMRLLYTPAGGDQAAAGQRRAAAAERAAAADAASGKGGEYVGSGAEGEGEGDDAAACVARVRVASAARIPQGAVQDTTGAGDAFIGSMLYSLATKQPLDHALRLAAVVAACNCTALGARPGMPRREQLRMDLL